MNEMPLPISRRHLLAGASACAAAALFPAATRAYAAGAVNFHKTYADSRMGQVHLLIARPATGTATRPALAIFHPTAQSGGDVGKGLLVEGAGRGLFLALLVDRGAGRTGLQEAPEGGV